MDRASPCLRIAVLLSVTLAAGCGGDKNKNQEASSSGAEAPSGAASAAALEPASSPFFVVLEAKAPIAFSALEGGVWIVDAARRQHATAAADAELDAKPMPEGLPSGPGRVVWVAGKMPRSVWLSFEKQRDDGKV